MWCGGLAYARQVEKSKSRSDSVIVLYDSPSIYPLRMKKNIVLIGEAFLELEPFEQERHASGSRFDLNLELRI